MTNPNWGLLQGNNALASFQLGAQMGTQKRQEREQRDHQNAMLEQRQQQLDQQNADRQAQAQRQQVEQRRADLPLMERLLTMAQDEGTYQQARQVAGQYGIDVAQLPPTFDPAWRDQQLATVKLLNTPQGQAALTTEARNVMMSLPPDQRDVNHPAFIEAMGRAAERIISYQPGGGVVGDNPATGVTRQIVQPGRSVAAPAPYNPNDWEEVEPQGQGGAGAPRIGSNFLDGF